MEIRYRPDIDGLRAIAVMSVILSHAGFAQFSAGIIGVDIFFVISGFLITGIIVGQQARGKFTISEFYERRSRRILPALSFVLVATTITGWVLLLPWELTRLGQSIVSVVTFSSNIYFNITTDYFSAAAETQPLIHTWSLAVEEQFYVLYPLLLILLAKASPESTRRVIIALTLLSVVLWICIHQFAPTFAFYMLPTRGWQLLLGAIVALNLRKTVADTVTREPRSIKSEALSSAGVVLMLSAIISGNEWFGEWTNPVNSMLAALGAAMVIAWGRQGGGSYSLLSWRPLTFVGLISYSAYLWHQPIFAYYRQVTVAAPTAVAMALLVLLVLAVASLSWYYIEVPFRDPRRTSVRKLALACAPALAVCLTLGLAAHARKGNLYRHPPEIANVQGVQTKKLACPDTNGNSKLLNFNCSIGTNKARPKYVIWGDSHAQSLGQGLQNIAATREVSAGALYAYAGCPPIPGLLTKETTAISCSEFNERVITAIEAAQEASLVVLVARWPANYEASRFNNGQGGVEPGGKIVPRNAEGKLFKSDDERIDYLTESLRENVKRLNASGKSVVVVLPWPEMGVTVPKYALNGMRFANASTVQLDLPTLKQAVVNDRQRRTRDALKAGLEPLRVRFIDPVPALCDGIYCRSGTADALWYSDDDHLSLLGIEEILTKTELGDLFGLTKGRNTARTPESASSTN